MKKIFSLTLALMLLFSCAAAESKDFTLTVPFLNILGMPVIWQDDYFRQDAHEYNHELCRLSLTFTFAAMDDGSENNTALVISYLDGLGFSDIEIQQYDVCTADSIGTVMARKSMDGRDLIAVAVRAGEYGDEWLNNLDCGDEGQYHQGFAKAARIVTDRIRNYAQTFGLSAPVLWMAGYSRGAAVANLSAAFIAEDGLAPDQDIFCYTFATPKTVQEKYAKAHFNIFNIVNPADIVPRVPLAEWCFDRYGRTLYLPSSITGNVFDQLLPAYLNAYRQLTGQEDTETPDPSIAMMAKNAEKGLSIAVPSRWRYADIYQPLLNTFFATGDFSQYSGSDKLVLAALGATVGNAVFEDEGIYFSMTEDVNAMLQNMTKLLLVWNQHFPAHYAAWLTAVPGMEMMTE